MNCGHCNEPLKEENAFLCGCGRQDICSHCAKQGRDHFIGGWNRAKAEMNELLREARWG